jgi:hypothetical protein
MQLIVKLRDLLTTLENITQAEEACPAAFWVNSVRTVELAAFINACGWAKIKSAAVTTFRIFASFFSRITATARAAWAVVRTGNS